MKRTAVIRVIFFFLLATCGALCQKRPSVDLNSGSQFDGSNSPEVRRQEVRLWNSLPDAPTPVQPSPQAQGFTEQANSPLAIGAVDASAGERRETELGHIAFGQQTRGPQTSLAALYQSVPVQKESAFSAFIGKYLYTPLLKQDSRHFPSIYGSFKDRASYAASRIFITRDDSGRMRLNTSYFIRVLTSAATQIAYRPYWAQYWAQTATARYNGFGSMIGGDLGINVLHEVGPGIRQAVKGHTAKFVSSWLTHGHAWTNVVPSR